MATFDLQIAIMTKMAKHAQMATVAANSLSGSACSSYQLFCCCESRMIRLFKETVYENQKPLIVNS
jgi:hypothetical protein